jgi:hypothetical protein
MTDFFKKTENKDSDEIRRMVDSRVMCEILEKAGWTLVYLESLRKKNPKTIANWVKKSVKGEYYGYYDTWVFKLTDDAAWFTLKWK